MPRHVDLNPNRHPPWLERDWQQFGPHGLNKTEINAEQASSYCRQLALSHYENFSIASRLTPNHLRRHLYHIYAYCRWSDDLADESPSVEEAKNRLTWWKKELDLCVRGSTTHPVMIALRSTLQTFELSPQPFYELLSAFQQDQTLHRYESDEPLEDYCRRSANPVGRILLQMAGIHSQDCFRWSDQICTGLQLANFCQDFSRDAANQRIYFPRSRWKQDNVTEAMIMQRRKTPELQRAAIRWLIEIRERFYDGWELTNHVPAWLARDVRLFAGGGLAILDRIRQKHGDVWSQRVAFSRKDKFSIFLRAFIFKAPPRRYPLRVDDIL
ncbi:MAG: squalene synthase HpnC [Pirellulaceae bacterium]|nr:squalene synthase HpnC [Pirellulaceae bacterium]